MLLSSSSCCRQVSFPSNELHRSCFQMLVEPSRHVCVCVCFVLCSSVDVMEEAKKLIGKGNRHLVMGDVVSAVGVFQDACSML